MFVGWMTEVERAYEMKKVQNWNLTAGFCGKFLFYCIFSKTRCSVAKVKGYRIWDGFCGKFCAIIACFAIAVYIVQLLQKSHGMWTGNITVWSNTSNSLTSLLPNRSSNNLPLILQCLIQTLKCKWFKALKNCYVWICSTFQIDYNLLIYI